MALGDGGISVAVGFVLGGVFVMVIVGNRVGVEVEDAKIEMKSV